MFNGVKYTFFSLHTVSQVQFSGFPHGWDFLFNH